MFHRCENCFGIPVFRYSRWYAEIWFCPPKTKIKEHFHELEDNWIVFLFGKAKFYKRKTQNEYEDSIKLKLWNIFKIFKIPRLCYHRFRTKKWPLVFLNIARFLPSVNPISASKDFKERTYA